MKAKYRKMGNILIKMFEEEGLTGEEAREFLQYFLNWLKNVTVELAVTDQAGKHLEN